MTKILIIALFAAFASTNAAADCAPAAATDAAGEVLDMAGAAGLAATFAGIGIPTMSIGSAMGLAASVTTQMKQLIALKTQVDAWNRQLTMISGSRGMGALAAVGGLASSSGMIPKTWDSVLSQAQDTTSTYGRLVQATAAKNAVLTPSQLANMSADARGLLVRTRNLGAMQKAMADTTLNVAGKQMAEIQALAAQIDTACDPKAVADLHAALTAKQMELESTRLTIYAMDQNIQAEQKAIELQQHESALKMLDRDQPAIRFSYGAPVMSATTSTASARTTSTASADNSTEP